MKDHGRGRWGWYHAGAEEPGMAAGAAGWRSGRTQETTHNDVLNKLDWLYQEHGLMKKKMAEMEEQMDHQKRENREPQGGAQGPEGRAASSSPSRQLLRREPHPQPRAQSQRSRGVGVHPQGAGRLRGQPTYAWPGWARHGHGCVGIAPREHALRPGDRRCLGGPLATPVPQGEILQGSREHLEDFAKLFGGMQKVPPSSAGELRYL